MITTAQKIIEFNLSLDLDVKTNGVEVMNPFSKPEVIDIVQSFYTRFYNDQNQRTFLIAINPGRFGAGVTGVPFTDPAKIESLLHTSCPLNKRTELSGKFIYELIDFMGGPDDFYSQFHFTNVSPLGFLKEGKNLNYYDIKELQEELTPWIVSTLNQQIEQFANREVAYTIGKGKNFKYIKNLNAEHNWFKEIVPLPHPRWIMQYKLSQKRHYIEDISNVLLEK